MRGIHGLLYLNVDNVGQFNVFGDDNVCTGGSLRKLFLNLFYNNVFLVFVCLEVLMFLCTYFPF